jgi:hypothetical protein
MKNNIQKNEMRISLLNKINDMKDLNESQKYSLGNGFCGFYENILMREFHKQNWYDWIESNEDYKYFLKYIGYDLLNYIDYDLLIFQNKVEFVSDDYIDKCSNDVFVEFCYLLDKELECGYFIELE